MPRQFNVLTQINLDDLVESFGWKDWRLPSLLLRRAFLATAQEFARQMLAFDAAVGRHAELAGAARMTLRRHYIAGLQVEGSEHLPARGPVLFLANHPGLADAISLCAAIGRADLNAIALRRPFLDSLENTAKHIFFVDGNLGNRVIAAHNVAGHLRGGGAVLSFPAGRIEPDPDLYADAADSLSGWADSAGSILRLAPETIVVPVLVRGVVWEKTAHHWLTRFKRTRLEREKLVAALQLVAMVSSDARPTTVRVRFAAPISAVDYDTTKPGALHQLVLGRMRQMMADAPVRPGALHVAEPRPDFRESALTAN